MQFVRFRIHADKRMIIEALTAYFRSQGFPLQGAEPLGVSTDVYLGGEDPAVAGYEVDGLEVEYQKNFQANQGVVDGSAPIVLSDSWNPDGN